MRRWQVATRGTNKYTSDLSAEDDCEGTSEYKVLQICRRIRAFRRTIMLAQQSIACRTGGSPERRRCFISAVVPTFVSPVLNLIVISGRPPFAVFYIPRFKLEQGKHRATAVSGDTTGTFTDCTNDGLASSESVAPSSTASPTIYAENRWIMSENLALVAFPKCQVAFKETPEHPATNHPSQFTSTITTQLDFDRDYFH